MWIINLSTKGTLDSVFQDVLKPQEKVYKPRSGWEKSHWICNGVFSLKRFWVWRLPVAACGRAFVAPCDAQPESICNTQYGRGLSASPLHSRGQQANKKKEIWGIECIHPPRANSTSSSWPGLWTEPGPSFRSCLSWGMPTLNSYPRSPSLRCQFLLVPSCALSWTNCN